MTRLATQLDRHRQPTDLSTEGRLSTQGRRSKVHSDPGFLHGERFDDDAYIAEAALKHAEWSFFSRGEITQNREFVEAESGHGNAYRIGGVSLGVVRDWGVAGHLSLGVGGMLAVNFVPEGLREVYGSRHPVGAMGFVRVKFD